MPRVKGDRGISVASIGTSRCCVDGCARQEAVCPGCAAISGSGPANIGGSPVLKATGLESAHDRRTGRVGIRFDFGCMVTGGVGIWVGTKLRESYIGKG